MKDISFNVNNRFAIDGLTNALYELCKNFENIALVFIGTDANIGDSLAPLSSSLLNRDNKRVFIYGSLNNPITAKQVPYIESFIKKAHPCTFIIVVDAAVGKSEDIGNIKALKGGIKPGLGVDKQLPLIGDVSIIGVVSEKNGANRLNNVIRLSNIFKMSNVISATIEKFLSLWENDKKSKQILNA